MMREQFNDISQTEIGQKNLRDYIDTLRRRRGAILLTAGGLFIVSVLIAFMLPPVYRSTATILIEEQEIPPDLVRSTITTYAWQRIQTISQRVMTRNNLMGLINKYDLYSDKRSNQTTEETIERMQKAIKLDPISADVIDPRTGRPMPAMIAFTLAYDGEGAEVTQKVANELTTLYLNENLRSRDEKTSEAYGFLTDETTKLSEHIADLEKKLAEFKEKNVNTLPELAQLNYQLMDRTEIDLRDTINQIRSLDERKFYLEGQLAQMNPNSPMFSASGERILDPVSRLKVLKTELASAAAQYSPDHPDVLRLQREIAGLERQTGAVSPNEEQAKEMSQLRSELAAAQEKYSADHPDVIRLSNALAALEASLKAPQTPEAIVAAEKPENPAYITLQAQLQAVNSDHKTLIAKRDELQVKLSVHEKRLTRMPQVEREYVNLKRDYENSQMRYRDLKAKQMEAEVGQQLEKERKGERFTLIDPPQLPEKPVKPNRIMILLLGFIMSMGGGLGYALVAENLDPSLRGSHSISAALGTAPLAVIPYMQNSEDLLRTEKTKRLLSRLAVAGAITVVILVPVFWIPWDVLWFKGLRVLSSFFGI
jgi:succinoglycan biosynthesis transport protein ExoP